MAALYYELDVLEALITESLHPKNLLRQKSLSERDFDQLNDLLLKEKETIKKRLKKVTYSYAKENHRKLYIQQHQFGVTRLKNRLIDFILPKESQDLFETPADNLEIKIYKRCLSGMNELFSFIREEFPQYFNYDERVPDAIVPQKFERLRPQLVRLKKKLLKASQDISLIEITIRAISNHFDSSLTYRKLNALKSLIKELEEFNLQDFSGGSYPPLVTLLAYLNFNTTSFKNYFIHYIYEEINKYNTLSEKIEMISFHYKEISQLPMKPCSTFLIESSSVQTEVATWLFNEMTHLEKKRTLELSTAVPFKEPGDPESEKGVYSALTVEELGLFFKIQKDTSLLKNKNMKQVAKSIAEYWHTKQKENISWQYLYNSMSSPDMETIRNLEDKLVGMVNWLRKMKSGMK